MAQLRQFEIEALQESVVDAVNQKFYDFVNDSSNLTADELSTIKLDARDYRAAQAEYDQAYDRLKQMRKQLYGKYSGRINLDTSEENLVQAFTTDVLQRKSPFKRLTYEDCVRLRREIILKTIDGLSTQDIVDHLVEKYVKQ